MLLVIDDRGTFGINERIYPEEFSSFLEGEEFYVPVVGRSGIDANGRFAITYEHGALRFDASPDAFEDPSRKTYLEVNHHFLEW